VITASSAGRCAKTSVPASISRDAIDSRVVGAVCVFGGTMVGGKVFVESIESCRVFCHGSFSFHGL
jgi:hypothetical protein